MRIAQGVSSTLLSFLIPLSLALSTHPSQNPLESQNTHRPLTSVQPSHQDSPHLPQGNNNSFLSNNEQISQIKTTRIRHHHDTSDERQFRLLLPCNTNEYDLSGVCQPCHASCSSCTGGSATDCSSCGANMNLSGSSSCDCIDGTYMAASFTCDPCHTTCATCTTAPDADYCLSCSSISPQFRELGHLASNGIAYPCQCLSMYYSDANGDCQRCSYACSTCVGAASSDCLSCVSAERNLGTNCSCPTGTFDASEQLACSACHYSCTDCTNSLATSCSSCKANRSYNSSNQLCECDSSFFEDSSAGNTCQPCDSTCKECSGSNSNTSCTVCSANRTKNASNQLCECNSHYFVNASNVCQICHYSCDACSNSTTCDICLANRFFNGSLCDCNPNFFEDTNNSNLCTACHSSCATCSSSNAATDCVVCEVNRTKNASTQLCECNSTFFESNSVCVSCHYSCATCSGTADTQCLTCGNNRTFDAYNRCVCQSLYFENSSNNNTCEPCHYSCGTCSGSADTQCLTCGNNRIFDAFNKCVCQSQYFQNSSNNNACEQCHASCAECTTNNLDTSCTSCFAQMSINAGTLKCTCDSGYYATSVNSCGQCDYSCKTCTSAGSSGCVTCETNRILQSNGTCLCPPSFFEDPNQANACMPCHTSCATCSGSNSNTDCITCGTNRSKQSGSNICDCNDRFYESAGVCLACHYSCQTCSGSSANTACTACLPPRSFNSSKCYCPSNTFSDSSNSYACTPCHATCLKCSGGSGPNYCTACGTNRHLTASNQCVCDDSFVEESGTCVPCHYSCTKCTNSTSSGCSQCQTHRSINGSNECPCDNYFFEDSSASNTCTACHASCQNCTGTLATQCTVCSANRTYDTASQLCLCNSNYIEDPATLVCLQCHYSCQECIGVASTDCKTCKPPSLRFLSNPAAASSECPCISKYYEDTVTKTCEPCHGSCSECTGPSSSECTLCDSLSLFRTSSTSNLSTPFSCICSSGYYEITPFSPICGKCHDTCLTCTGGNTTTDCLTCYSSDFRVEKATPSPTTECVCDTGYYDDLIHATCQQCHYSCETCLGPLDTDCLSCFTSRFYTSIAQSILPRLKCECPFGRFEDVTAVSCEKCNDLCESCTGSSSTECLSCYMGQYRKLNNSTHQCLCWDSMYEVGSDLVCFGCDNSCLTCSGRSKFQCVSCDPANNRSLTLPFYTCECNIGYYNINIIGTTTVEAMCAQCASPCESCVDFATNCTSCASSSHLELIGSTCQCIDGYYFDSSTQLCVVCNAACMTCSNSGASSDCLGCAENYIPSILPIISTPITCILDPNTAVNITLNRCDASCAVGECSLTNHFECSLCSSNRIKIPGTNYCVCPDGYFERTSTRTCEICHYSCKNCVGEGPLNCSTCGNVLLNKRNVTASVNNTNSVSCVCADGFYEIEGQNICGTCNEMCRTCNGTDDYCISCRLKQNLIEGSCYCFEGYAFDVSLKACVKCDQSCDSCIGSAKNMCISCSSLTRVFVTDASNASLATIPTGTCDCLYGYFDQLNNGDCLACDSTCQTCVNQADYCLTCDANKHRGFINHSCVCNQFYFESTSGNCLQCAYDCLTCESQNECLTCDGSTRVLDTTSNRCVCKQEFFENSMRECQLCEVTCGSCITSSSNCVTCHENASLTSNLTCECVSGYFTLPSGKCEKCKAICLACDDDNSCNRCESQAKMYLNSESNLCECYLGYVLLFSDYSDTFYCIESAYIDISISSESTIRSIFESSLPTLIYIYQSSALLSLVLGRLHFADTAFVMFLEIQMLLYSNVAKPRVIRSLLNEFHEKSFLIHLNSINLFRYFLDEEINGKSVNPYFGEFGISDEILLQGGGAIQLGIIGLFVYFVLRKTIFAKKNVSYTYLTKLISFRKIASKIYHAYAIQLSMSCLKILSVNFMFTAVIAMQSDKIRSIIIGYVLLALTLWMNVNLMRYAANNYDKYFRVFENIKAKTFRLKMLFLETIIYIIPFLLLCQVDGLWFILNNFIVRMIFLVPLMYLRLDSKPVNRIPFVIVQVILSAMYLLLGIIIQQSRQKQLSEYDQDQLDVMILVFEGLLMLFLVAGSLIVLIDSIVAIAKLFTSKHKFDLTVTHLYKNSTKINKAFKKVNNSKSTDQTLQSMR